MGWLTEALARISPAAALRRERARTAYDVMKRSYDGAAKSRRLKQWTPKNTSANAENRAAAATLRARSRDLVRNDAFARRGVNIMTECAVGGGIIPSPDTGDDRLNAQILAAFEAWSEAADADEQHDFFGLQDLACQTIVESGDVLIRRRRRRADDGLEVPMQVQLMEPDHLDSSRLNNGGNDVVAGIELDRLNRRQAYWLYPTHPGDTTIRRLTRLSSVRVPADQIGHAYAKRRPGQLIGVPWLATAMVDLRDLADYEQAELVRKKIEACFAAFVTTTDSGDPTLLGEEDSDDDGRLEKLEPGMIEYLEQGEDVNFANPTPTSGYGEFTRTRLHRIATAMDMPYMLLTGDVSQANWSSYKAGIVPFKQMVRRFQKRTLIPMALRPMWRWFIDAAFVAGLIDRQDYSVRWTLPGFEPIDRLKEAMADQAEARIGKKAMPSIIREAGGDPDKTVDEYAKWYELTDEKAFVFDSDPRKVSNAGLTQARPDGSVIPPTTVSEEAGSQQE